MKKSRIILWFSYGVVFLFTLFRITQPLKEKNPQNELTGRILEIQEKEKSITYTIQGREKWIVYDYEKQSMPLQLGEYVRIQGEEKKIEKNRNFYLFDYKKYLLGKNIKRAMVSKRMEVMNKKITFPYKIKNRFLNYLNSFSKGKEYMLLFLYGDNTLDEEIYANYQRIGVVHLFAISGMHISLFVFLHQKCIRNEKVRKYTLLSFLTMYLFLTKFSPGIARAILCENGYLITNGKIKRKDILLFVFFLLLLYNPYFLYHIGFQLSFILSFALGFIKRQTYFKGIIKTSLVSFLISFPLIVNRYFEMNLLTPFYNVFFIPFVSFLLFPSVLLTFFFPFLEGILCFQIQVLEKATILFLKIPSVVSFGYFSWIPFCFFYGLLFLSFKKRIFFFLLFLFLFLFYFKHSILKQNRITMLDVGQGDSILIEKDRTILIDTGGERQKTKAIDILIPSLKARGIHKIDALILTHGDFDHAGSAIELLHHFKVAEVYFNGAKDTELEKEIMSYLKKAKIPYYKIEAERVNLEKLGITLFHFQNSKNENEDSLVTYIKMKTYNILLMGDAGEETEEKLIARYKFPKMDILKVGHHGSKYSSSKEFLRQVRPQYALISVAKKNSYGHPSLETCNRLTDVNTTILKTSTKGSVEVNFKKKISIRTCFMSATQ